MKDDTQSGDYVIALEELPHVGGTYRFAGAQHGDIPFSVILIRTEPASGPPLHRHPYVEAWVVQAGEATFRVGEETIVVGAGHIVIGPPNVPHGFKNTGAHDLQMVAIHGAGEFQTEWLDPVESA